VRGNTPADGNSKPGSSRQGLAWIFAILAILNVVTALGGLSVGHYTLTLLGDRQAANKAWNEQNAQLIHLRDTLAELDVPANSVFQTEDVALERNRLARAEGAFGLAFTKFSETHEALERRCARNSTRYVKPATKWRAAPRSFSITLPSAAAPMRRRKWSKSTSSTNAPAPRSRRSCS
jgi:hypothetical protein